MRTQLRRGAPAMLAVASLGLAAMIGGRVSGQTGAIDGDFVIEVPDGRTCMGM